MNSSIRRWSLGGTQSSALNRPDWRSPRGTCAAMRAGRSETSNDWIARIPDSPATSRRHTSSSPMPSGVTSPMPVTTTRLMPGFMLRELPRRRTADGGDCGSCPARLGVARCYARSAMRLDEADRILDGYDLLRRVIRDFAPEFLFKSHHQLDRIAAVGAQIVDETGILGHLGFVASALLDD